MTTDTGYLGVAAGWQTGDLAVSLCKKGWRPANSDKPSGVGPAFNEVCRVRAVGVGMTGGTVLWLDGYPGDAIRHAFYADRFRKIRPDEQKGEREDWQLLLDSMKPNFVNAESGQ